MNIIKRISLVMLIILTIGFAFNVHTVNAEGGFADMMGTVVGEVDESSETADSEANTKISSMLVTIITIVRIAGICIAIAMLLVLAMKYMTAAAGEKADIKKSAVQYVVGAVVLFAAVGILGIIGEFASNISGK